MSNATLSEQEIFDGALSHLRRQGHPARTVMGSEPQCAYRTPEGDSCGIGCFIRDDEYSTNFEGFNVYQIMYNAPASFVQRMMGLTDMTPISRATPRLVFLAGIQRWHDGWDGTPEDLEKGAKIFARLNGLNYTPPPEMTAADILALAPAPEAQPAIPAVKLPKVFA